MIPILIVAEYQARPEPRVVLKVGGLDVGAIPACRAPKFPQDEDDVARETIAQECGRLLYLLGHRAAYPG